MTAGLGLDGTSWLAGGEGAPGQAGAGTGCLPSSQCSSRGAGSAQAGPGLLGWLSAAPVMALGPGRGWRPGGRDTSQELHGGRGQVMLVLEPRAQDSAEGREGSVQPTGSSSLQAVTASPRLLPEAFPDHQAGCSFLPLRVLGSQDPAQIAGPRLSWDAVTCVRVACPSVHLSAWPPLGPA